MATAIPTRLSGTIENLTKAEILPTTGYWSDGSDRPIRLGLNFRSLIEPAIWAIIPTPAAGEARQSCSRGRAGVHFTRN